MGRLLRILLLLPGFLTPLCAQDLQEYLRAARTYHAAFQDSIRDLSMTREATIFSTNGDQRITFRRMVRGKLFREETVTDVTDENGNSEPVSVIEIFDGKQEWQINAAQGKQLMGSGGRRFQSPGIEYWIEPPEGSRIVGSDVIHNRDCWRVESDPIQTYPYERVWLDKEYFLMIRAESWSENHESTVIENTNLRFVPGGFAIPARTLIKKQWQPSMELILTELRINKGLPDSLFNVDTIEIPRMPVDSE